MVKRCQENRPHDTFDAEAVPTVAEVYAQLKVAAGMLSRIPDPGLSGVKREMYVLEDMLWQYAR